MILAFASTFFAGAYFGRQELEVKRPLTTIDERLGDARLTKDDRMLAF
jgi:hypothetical protein